LEIQRVRFDRIERLRAGNDVATGVERKAVRQRLPVLVGEFDSIRQAIGQAAVRSNAEVVAVVVELRRKGDVA
jgi:hypothetical protein